MADLAAYAVCAPGLESLVAEELTGLGLAVVESERGGVALRTDLAGLYRANLHSRLATRLLLRLATFRARTFPDLLKQTATLPWEAYLAPGTPRTVKAASRASRLYILKRIEATVTEAIAGRIGETPSPPTPLPRRGGGTHAEGAETISLPPGGGGTGREETDNVPTSPQQILVRLVHNECMISLDTSGELLHRRGYRLATAKAPLRETLACAVLRLAGWQPETPLLDPMCGAGTFAIEAARWALGIPPGGDRIFACQSWPTCDRRTWEALCEGAVAAGRPALPAPIIASDRDPGAVRMACDNARRAGIADHIAITRQDLFDLRPDGPPGLVVINAPYGRRVGHGDLRALYRRLGDHLRTHLPGWSYAVLCGNGTLARATGLAPDHRHALLHGGQQIPLLCGRL